jgi:hypothetical protein
VWDFRLCNIRNVIKAINKAKLCLQNMWAELFFGEKYIFFDIFKKNSL